jgi:hypothetical protein
MTCQIAGMHCQIVNLQRRKALGKPGELLIIKEQKGSCMTAHLTALRVMIGLNAIKEGTENEIGKV